MKKKVISKHYKNKRYNREKLINKYLNGDGRVIDSFIVDRGHTKGLERHDITENGVIIIYNALNGKLVTKLIGREGQIKRYYKNVGREPPPSIIYLAQWHEDLGYNK